MCRVMSNHAVKVALDAVSNELEAKSDDDDNATGVWGHLSAQAAQIWRLMSPH